MVVISDLRGHEIYHDGLEWRYKDNNELIDNIRPCKKCGKYPTKEGYDACLGYIKGAKNACCGHGLDGGYIQMEEGK